MNASPPLLLALCLLSPALRAAVPVSGTGAYTENFNLLSTGTVTWTQGSTVSSWHMHRTATTPPTSLPAANGSGTFTGNAYNLGVAGAADRALGSAPTTAHGNYSRVVILRNAGTSALQITRVSYGLEVYRTNQFLTTVEPVIFSWQLAATESALTAPLAAAGTLAGYTTDAGLGLNIVFTGAGMPAAPGQVAPPVTFSRSAAPASPLLVNPGQYLALRWEDINESNSTDAYLGLDDVTVEYQPVVCLVTPEVLNLQRNDNGTPSLLTDDTWGFTLRVTGVATGAQGWSASAPAISGSYGGSVPLSFPISVTSQTITVRDVQFPDCMATITVQAPPPAIPFVLADRPQSITFDPAPQGAHSYTRTLAHSDLGWSWPGASTATGVTVQPGSVPAPPRYFDFNASNDQSPLVTESVNVTAAGGAVKVILRLAAYTTSDSGMETDDFFRTTLYVSNTPATGTWVEYHYLLAQSNGPFAFAALRISDPGINYGTAAVPFPAVPFLFREYSAYVPAGVATYARVEIEGLNDSNSEHWLVDSIRFEKAVCEARAVLLDATRSNPQFTSRDPDGDVFTARVAVTNPVPGPSGHWVAGSSTGIYAPLNSASVQSTLGPWPVSGGPVTVTIADADDPPCFTTLTVTPPPRLVFGTLQARGLTEAICTGGGDLRWTSNEAERTLHMESATYDLTGSDRNQFYSQGISLPGSGLLYVSGIVQAQDLSTGSNFESSDFIRIAAQCTTGAGMITFPLLTKYDKDSNGDITGYGQGGGSSDLIDYMANIQLDELNRNQRHYSEAFTERLLVYGVLPADTRYLRIEVAGRTGGNASTSNSEFLTLRELRITDTPPRAGLDWDGDGQFDADEFLTGTDPFDPQSLTRFLTASAFSSNGNYHFSSTLQTVSGVHYALYTSSNLSAWYLLGTPVAGDGTIKAFSSIDDEVASHTFFKVIAKPDPAFPAALP